MRFGTRAVLATGLVAGVAACSNDVAVTFAENADASGGADGGRLSQQNSSSSQDSGLQDSGSQKNDTPSIDAGKPALPCSPTPYCPDPKLGLTPFDTYNYYLQSGRWFRVDPTTHQVHKVCEPVKMPVCDETKGETPEQNGCDLPRCADAKTCDPIPSSKVDPMYVGPAFMRNFANYPQALYAQSNFLDQNYAGSGNSMFDGSLDALNFPMIFDNVPDCKPGEKPKEGESYYTCDIIPTCAQAIPYCEPLPRCAPGQAAMSFIPGGTENGAPEITVDNCINTVKSRLGFLTSPYHIDPTPAIEKLCGPSGLNPKNHVFVVQAQVNCLPVRECNPGEIPVDTKTPLPITLNLGALGTVASTTGPNYEFGGNIPSCEPIPSCPKK